MGIFCLKRMSRFKTKDDDLKKKKKKKKKKKRKRRKRKKYRETQCHKIERSEKQK